MSDSRSRPGLLQLSGFTRANRLLCISRLRDAIVMTCGGWITDFYEFSNISLNLHFEIPIERLPILSESLLAAEVHLSSQTLATLNHLVSGMDEGPVRGTLQVTFIHNEPDLRRHIPAVPG
jgi:hypothetical protein